VTPSVARLELENLATDRGAMPAVLLSIFLELQPYAPEGFYHPSVALEWAIVSHFNFHTVLTFLIL